MKKFLTIIILSLFWSVKSYAETKDSVYLDEVKGITKNQLSVLSSNEIKTVQDFIDADDCQYLAADLNGDQMVNVLDILNLVNLCNYY